MSEALTQIKDYLRAARREPLLLTMNGKPYVTVAAAGTNADLERLAVAMHPKFQAIMERSERRWREEGGLTSDQMREELWANKRRLAVRRSSVNLRDIAQSINDAVLRDRVSGSDVVLAPNSTPADHPAPLFPSHTRELFHFLQEHAPADLAVEIASTDDDYQELVLHSDLWALPMIVFATPFAGEVLVELVSSYIYDGLRNVLPTRKVEVAVEFVLSRAGSSVSLKYQGPAEGFQRSMSKALQAATKGIRRRSKSTRVAREQAQKQSK